MPAATASPPNRRAAAAQTRPARRHLAACVLVLMVVLGSAAVAPADPAATFSISDERPARNQAVVFQAAAECVAPVSCTWSGDEGLGASGREVAHSFAELGSKRVTLTIDDPTEGSGEPEILTRTVDVVNRAPTASISATATGLDVSFGSVAADADGDALTYAWSFGDGSSATDPTPVHTYSGAGTYTVTLTVSDGHESTEATESVRVVAPNAAPTAAFTFTTEDLTARLDATASSDPDGDRLTHTWSFGDGSTAVGATVSHTFTTSNHFPVVLTVTDPAGASHSVTRQVLVNRRPRALIAVSHEQTVVGREVTFRSISSDPDGDALNLAWGAGDPTGFRDGSRPSLTRSFATPGVHEVRLQVTDEHGAVSTTSTTVEVLNSVPVGAITATPASPLTGEAVALTSRASDPDGGSLQYAWDVDGDGFDDGTTASVESVTFALPETRRVRLRLTDEAGATAVEELSIEVRNRPPTADFDRNPDIVERGRPVTFTSRARDAEELELAEQSWDLDGDGDYDDAFGTTASHTFHSGRVHEVGLRVVDAHGGVAIARIPLVLGNRSPVASFTVAPERPVVGQTLELASQSSDPDGTLVEVAWDLDGDGEFDDATGDAARLAVERTGPITVGLRVTDDEGGADISRRDVEVGATGVAEPIAAAPPETARMLTPFPSVRVAGRLTRRGARFRVVSVSAPRGARVAWSCASRRCRAARRTATGRPLRIRALEREFPAGSVIELRVTRRGRIGKYTRIHVRRNRAPARRDMCLPPRSEAPRACSS